MSRANNKKNNNRKRPPIESYDDIATRTRRQKMAIVSKWDIPIPIIIEIISWLNQEDLMNMSLVSKQLHDIIANEPGNKNKILPVFEVSGTSIKKFFQNLKRHLMNKKTKKKLQSYRIMRFKDVHKFNRGDHIENQEISKIVENTHMNGITSLDLSSSSQGSRTTLTRISLIHHIVDILPNLREADYSSTAVDVFGALCGSTARSPLLEKITLNNNGNGVFLSGDGIISRSGNLREINMNNVKFLVSKFAKMADLNNHQEIFIFHNCSRALERVSILNMTFHLIMFGPGEINEDQKLILTQNALIKFVRNVPSLRWLRSDLTSANIEMLRLERPEIELLN